MKKSKEPAGRCLDNADVFIDGVTEVNAWLEWAAESGLTLLEAAD